MDLISLVLLIIVIILPFIPLIEKYRKRRKIAQELDSFGGEKYYPIIGTEIKLIKAGRKNFFKEYLRRNKKFGPVFRSWMSSNAVIHLMKPEHIELVLNNSDNVNKGPHYDFMKPWFGNGLLTTEKNKWRIHRKLLTPTFHFSILDNFSEVFATKAQMLADQILPLADGHFFDVFPFLTHCALDVICETAMGVKINAMQHSDSEYVRAVYGMLEKIIERMFNPFYQNDFIYKLTKKGRDHEKYLNILHAFTEKVIRERQKQLEDANFNTEVVDEEEKLVGTKRKTTFLDLLLVINRENDKFHLSFQDIRDEVDTFMFGGHDSSTVTVCWTLFLLGNNLEVQEKLYKELEGIFHGEERPVTPQDILEMKYLERVIKETLRTFTVTPSISRRLTKEIIINGHKIPPGTVAALHLYELHKDPTQFPDPERFDPDRFLPENAKNRHPFAFVPFSAGPRNCIGQKFAMRTSKTVISTLIRKYKVKSLQKPDEVDCFFDIFLRPQNGMHLSFEPRNKV